MHVGNGSLVADDPGSLEGQETAIRKWLAGEGYPVEYATARTLKRTGFETEQGHYFVDFGGGRQAPIAREIDVVARIAGNPFVSLVAECKNPKQPWVVMVERRPLSIEETIDALAATSNATAILRERATRAVGAGNPVPDYLAARDSFGFAIEEAKPRKTGDADKAVPTPYFALRKAVGAAMHEISLRQFQSAVVLVAVVVDGPLWQLTYDDAGAEIVQPVRWQRLLWRGSSRPTIVDVVHIDAVEAHARLIHAAATQIAGALMAAGEDERPMEIGEGA